jgi:nucleotide-binding universal stress UspA family protein
MVRRILVPIDLTPLGEAKLPVTREYALAFDAEVLLLHILPPKALDSEAVLPREASARAYLDVLVAGMTAAGIRAAALVRAGPTASSIVEEAQAQGADLIILGANVRPVLRSVVIGSVADEVVRAAHCPVLLVRPALDAEAPRLIRSFSDDAARSGPLRRRSLGVRTVEVGRIIGTVGRDRELGADFRPIARTRADNERFERIKAAMEEGHPLPPPELYKLGFGYYVLDGHHRVAAARMLGVVEVDANVTEFVPMADPEAARTFAERRAFEQSTGLTDIGAARAESYRRLAEMVEEYRGEHGIGSYRDAAQRWYGEVYRALWQRVRRRRRLIRYFPGDRTADFIARVGAWRAETMADGGTVLTWDEALDGFVATVAAERRAALNGAEADTPPDRSAPAPEAPDTDRC